MGKKYDFQYIVIGAGPAGEAAALGIASARKKVAIIDAKMSIEKAKDFAGKNIAAVRGYATLLNNHTVEVGGKEFTTETFVVATGTTLSTEEITLSDAVDFITPEMAIRAKVPPKVVVVVGAGEGGCRAAERFARLGSRVILLEATERILPREDKEVAETLTKYYTERLKMTVLTSMRVTTIERNGKCKRVIFTNNGSRKMVQTSMVVMASGSQPVVDLGLENARIKYRKTGVLVDKDFRTTAKNCFAIGSVLGKETSTERASYEGALLANNLVSRAKNLPNYHGFARVTRTMPEVAVVGMSEDDLIKRARKYRKAIVEFENGFVKLLADGQNHIIGAVIVSPHAKYLIQELAMAVRHHFTALEVASTPHLMDEENAAIKEAAKKLIGKK